MRSNKIIKKDLFKKKIDKGEFYFFKTKSQKLNTHDLLEIFVPLVLQKIQWKKSMKWGDFDLNWGRPLKSILALFDNRIIKFMEKKSYIYNYVSKEKILELYNKELLNDEENKFAFSFLTNKIFMEQLN